MTRILRIQLIEDGTELFGLNITTSHDAATILRHLQTLLDDKPATIPQVATTPQAKHVSELTTVGKRYRKLAEYLSQHPSDTVRMTFTAVERILETPLPPTARGEHIRSWWANTDSHSQGRAWLSAGWKVYTLDIENEVVEWRRTQQ